MIKIILIKQGRMLRLLYLTQITSFRYIDPTYLPYDLSWVLLCHRFLKIVLYVLMILKQAYFTHNK